MMLQFLVFNSTPFVQCSLVYITCCTCMLACPQTLKYWQRAGINICSAEKEEVKILWSQYSLSLIHTRTEFSVSWAGQISSLRPPSPSWRATQLFRWNLRSIVLLIVGKSYHNTYFPSRGWFNVLGSISRPSSWISLYHRLQNVLQSELFHNLRRSGSV